jgi:hypothetical protein
MDNIEHFFWPLGVPGLPFSNSARLRQHDASIVLFGRQALQRDWCLVLRSARSDHKCISQGGRRAAAAGSEQQPRRRGSSEQQLDQLVLDGAILEQRLEWLVLGLRAPRGSGPVDRLDAD